MMTKRSTIIAASAAAVLLAAIGLWRSDLLEGVLYRADLMRAGPLGEQAIGATDAPVTMIVYSALTCPHCARFETEIFPALKEQYIDTGKVRFIMREFPLNTLGNAAAMLPRCAGNDNYFPTVERLFRTQRTWNVEEPLQPLFASVQPQGFTEDSFKACLTDQRVADGIEWVRTRAMDKLKVRSTPTFFINGERHVGFLSMADVEKLIGK